VKYKTAAISGSFSRLHSGHIAIIDFAKAISESVTIILERQAEVDRADDRHLQFVSQSLEQVAGVDRVLVVANALAGLKDVKPEVVIKGGEFRDKYNPERELIEQWGGEILFFDEIQISTVIRDFSSPEYPIDLADIPREIRSLVVSKQQQLLKILEGVRQLRPLVLGDPIVDHWVECTAVGMSQEDFNVVHLPSNERKQVGGAALVAKHLHGIAGRCCYLFVNGIDDDFKVVDSDLSQLDGLDRCCFGEKGRITVRKTRFCCNNVVRFRLNNYTDEPMRTSTQEYLYRRFEELSENAHIVLFSDFNYGGLPSEYVKKIIETCGSRRIFMGADSQKSSQAGGLVKYKGVQFVSATEFEVRDFAASIKLRGGLEYVGSTMVEELDLTYLFVKLGSSGVIGFQREVESPIFMPSINKKPLDLSGAGDSMLSIAALSLSYNGELEDAMLLGSLASALQVAKAGASVLNSVDLRRLIYQISDYSG